MDDEERLQIFNEQISKLEHDLAFNRAAIRRLQQENRDKQRSLEFHREEADEIRARILPRLLQVVK